MMRLLRLYKLYGLLKAGWDQLAALWKKPTQEVPMPPMPTVPGGQTDMNNGKPWFSSLTIIVNTVGAVIGANSDQVMAFVSAHPTLALCLAALANILLRFRTDSPVK